MEKQYSAGGILINKNNEVYLLHKLTRNEWVLPKGKLEDGENSINAAEREIKEETGFFKFEILYKYPILISHYQFTDEKSGNKYDKFVTYYLYKVTEEIQENTKEMNEEGLTGNWFNLSEAKSKVSHEDSKKALEAVERILKISKTDIFLLGGNSSKNLDWIKIAEKEFSGLNYSGNIIFYEHWTQPNTEINLEFEAKKLTEMCEHSGDFTVFAKSAGVMITLIAIKDYGLSPKKCVFVGFPIEVLDGWGINYIDYLQGLNINCDFYQNSDDPTGSFENLQKILKKLSNSNIKIYEENGNTHEYNNFQNYKIN